MAKTNGYVGTVEVETRGVSRIWFSLTESDSAADWVRIGPNRAWFTINLETADRPMDMGKLTLIMGALRSGLAIRVSHGGAIDRLPQGASQ